MVAACVLPWLLPVPVGIVWLIVSQLAVMPTFIFGLHLPPIEALMQSLLYAGFASFVFVTSLVARQQAQAREEQRRLNNELRATRALLAESSRLSERMRISRELHDLLGHHLTALSLNLEVASHLADGKVQDHVRQAHTLARLLLTDVREAVSQLREDGAVEMSTALRTLTEGVLAPDIHLEMPEPFPVEDPEHANVLLRCTQEIITNAVRHAQADHLWLCFRQSGNAIEVSARDDGRGVDHLALGNGLRGMRERLSQHAGTVEITTAQGQGFLLTLNLPMEKPA
jgi:signal transduction histidine kinase